ncbi:MAG: hypothetical protein CMJ29_08450 [Phycisphaerae bacterium]|nr:hypothetical protein [Phycisphaerae bacterium]|tara:strand:- start:2979 stop:3476 length:498 start_codon:yes stop_codon:yes gene_type:complete
MATTRKISESAMAGAMGRTYSPMRANRMANRWLGLVVALVGLALIGVASSLTPAEEGIGTHKSLGLPECNWIATMDLPCPTCGMTTAFSHTVRGNWLEAMQAQPLGLVFCIVAAMAVLGGLWTLLTGASVGSLVATVWNRWWVWGLIVLALLAWVWKVLSHIGVF